MKEGDVALAALPQANGQIKPRPVILLRSMPPFADWLVCGISTQLHQVVKDMDEIIEPADGDFTGSGLKAASVIRLGFLIVLPTNQFRGIIGRISPQRHERLLQNLCRHLGSAVTVYRSSLFFPLRIW
jgi:mRNA interferase MazF